MEAEAAAERERERLEAEARAAEAARVAAEAAAERERLEAEARTREQKRVEAEVEYEVDLDSDQFSDFRPEAEERRSSLLQLMPLGVWAKVEPRQTLSDNGDREDDLRHLMDGLDLPTDVAAMSYAGGCRIRRVRVPAARTAPRGRTGGSGSRPVILSKRALNQARDDNETRQ